MDSILKMGLVFFVCLLSFAVGTFVGKKFSDYNHQVAVYEPQKDNVVEADGVGPGETAAVTPGKEGETEKMTDSDVAEIAKEFATPEEAATGTAAAGEKERAPSSEASESAEKQAFAKVEGHNEIPAPAPTEKSMVVKQEEAPAAKKGLPSGFTEKPNVKTADGQFTIQVVSLASEKEAKEKASQLKDQNYVAFYVPAVVNGKTWYRVNIGLSQTQMRQKNSKLKNWPRNLNLLLHWCKKLSVDLRHFRKVNLIGLALFALAACSSQPIVRKTASSPLSVPSDTSLNEIGLQYLRIEIVDYEKDLDIYRKKLLLTHDAGNTDLILNALRKTNPCLNRSSRRTSLVWEQL